MIGRLVLGLVLCPVWAAALTLDFPGNAVLVGQEITPESSIGLPTGPWVAGAVPTETAEGDVTRQIWQIDAPGVSTLQILAPLRQQLRREGYDVLFECQTKACGGFDFRFATDVASPPDMIVDLGDFRFLSARNADGSVSLSLFISRSETRGYVQVTRIGPSTGQAALGTTDAPALRQVPVASVSTPDSAGLIPDTDLGSRLDREGHLVLDDLTFETGSAQLGAGPFPSLTALAAYLSDHPSRVVALVGHTDSSGSLEANIALSRRRAASVLERLVSDYAVPRSQLDAQGMGYLAPIATNLTPEGRDRNRRVEVIVTSTN